MPTIPQIKIGNTIYEIKDAEARASLSAVNGSTIETEVVNGYWGYTGTPAWHGSSGSYRSSEMISISPGMMLRPTNVNGYGWYTTFDESKNPLDTIIDPTVHKPNTVGWISFPQNAKYVTFNFTLSNNTGLTKVRFIWNNIYDYYIYDNLKGEVNISVNEAGYWSSSATPTWKAYSESNKNMSTYMFKVSPGVKVTAAGVESRGWFTEFNANKTPISSISVSTASCMTVTAGENTEYMALNFPTETSAGAAINTGLYNVKMIIGDVSKGNNIYVSLADEVLTVGTRYTVDKDLWVVFKKKGPNTLPDFAELWVSNNYGPYPDISKKGNANVSKRILPISTDWHGPYIMETTDSSIIPDPHTTDRHYTGGNHGYLNDGSDTDDNTPTANCRWLTYYIDGQRAITYEGLCNSVEIVWENDVQAFNTKKANGTGAAVLRERLRMVFDGYEWKTYYEFSPLKNIIMYTYHGLQVSGMQYKYKQPDSDEYLYTYARFVGGEDRLISNKDHDPQSTTYGKIIDAGSNDRDIHAIRIYGNEHGIEMAVDNSYDIGDRRYNTSIVSGSIAHTNGNKAYLSLVRSDEGVAMTPEEVFYARGSYRFFPVTNK